MKMLRFTLVLAPALFVGAALGAAEDITLAGNAAFPLAQEGATARAVAMGSTYVGIAEGASSLLWNPAGLATLRAPELELHHKSSLLGSVEEIAVLGLPLSPYNGLGLAFNYADNGVFEGRDEAGNLTGNFNARNYGAHVGWGYGDLGGLSLGLALKINQATLADTSYTSFAGDAGLLWTCRDLSLGVAYTNFGPEVAGRQLAQGLRAGLSAYAARHTDFQWLFAASAEAQTNGPNSIHLGVENTLYQFLALRAGYAFDIPMVSVPGLTGWTFGAGFIIDAFSLDYAYVPMTEVGDVQRVSVAYRFGGESRGASPALAVGRAYGAPDANLNPGERRVVLTDLSFERDEAGSEALSREGREAIDANLNEVEDPQGPGLRIEGRTSVLGSTDDLRSLGQKRSEMVRNYLVEKGLPASRVTVMATPGDAAANDAGMTKSIYLILVR